MREKQWKIIDEQFISYYGGTGHLISDGECEFWLWHGKEESQKVCDKLNSILDENEQLKKENKHLRCTIESNSQDDYINYLKKQNEQLKQELFEARKDYLIETADISDKLYLEDEIEEERKEIFGDNNDQMKGMWND